MNWIEVMGNAICYIEENLTDDLAVGNIAREALVSEFYFQKSFSMLCGMTVGEYIRLRRLTLAGIDVISTGDKIIDIAVKYGYDSPDSFTRAFTRFHGATPSAVRKGGALVKSFAPLKIKFTLEGGRIMDYKIVKKEAFTVFGKSSLVNYDNSYSVIPKMWDEHRRSGDCQTVCGMYGICVESGAKEFEYMIADNYLPWNDIPEGFKAVTIPAFTWAVFPCKGAMPDALQSVNQKIFSEWLPNCRDYEIAGGYNVELYSPADQYENGTASQDYYSEIWIPVKKK